VLKKIHWYWYPFICIPLAVASNYGGLLERIGSHTSETLSVSLPIATLAASALVEVYIYLFVVGALQLAAFAALILVLTPLLFTRGLRVYAAAVERVLEFSVALLLWGAVGNVVWVALAREKLYVAGDPFLEWVAFIPYSSNIYDYQWGTFRGHLIGTATDEQLRVLWGAIAAGVWVATWLTLRFVHRRVTRVASRAV
jgi:hypothetical protein